MIVVSRLYDNYADASSAVTELERMGIPHADISIVANNSEGWYRDDDSSVTTSRRMDRDADGVDDRAEGAGKGAGIGAALGGVARFLFLLQFNRHVGIGREADLVAFHLGDEPEGDVVVVAFVRALAAVGLGQLDAVAVDMIHRPDMDAVGADHFHMLADAP